MRVICLDVGEKRIGVAVSDLLDLTAQGVETIWTKGFERDAARVMELCKQYETDRVLCGLPKNMDGTEGFQAERVRQFAEKLSERGLNVRFEDERLTTKLATSLLIEGDVRRGSARTWWTSWRRPTSCNPSWIGAAGGMKHIKTI